MHLFKNVLKTEGEMIPEGNLVIRNGKKINRDGKYLHKYHRLLSSSKYI